METMMPDDQSRPPIPVILTEVRLSFDTILRLVILVTIAQAMIGIVVLLALIVIGIL